MEVKGLTKIFVFAVIGMGIFCVAGALATLPLANVDIRFFLLCLFTIFVGSQITIKIPSLKSQVSVSDTFIFLAIIMFGGELGILLAAVEAGFSASRFCKTKLTVVLNMASMALSTTVVVVILHAAGLYNENILYGRGDSFRNFLIALCVIAFSQFFANTFIAATYDTITTRENFFNIWKKNYLWVFITYFLAAVNAGILAQLSDSIGFGVILAAFPIIIFLYLTYKMYLKNIKISMEQADQAEKYAEILENQSVALKASEEKFRNAFKYAPIGIGLVTPLGNWIKVNHALCDILGYTEEEFLADNFQSIIFHNELGEALSNIRQLLAGKITSFQLEQRYVHKNGGTVWTLCSVSSTGSDFSDGSALIFQIQDITDKKVAEQKLQYEATHDALTDLPNRSFFISTLSDALSAKNNGSDANISVLFIDIDRFKTVNDNLGHHIGDLLLEEIAQRLVECVRPSDVVGRLGGDEFTILVRDHHSPIEALQIAERIAEYLSAPFLLEDQTVYTSASIGILHATPEHKIAEDMMRDADFAMYQAKRNGRSQIEVFNEKITNIAKDALKFENDLREAVKNNEFSVYYQPVYDVLTGEIDGVEALTRWHHPHYGKVSPIKFIALAEELGIINELSDQILRKACTEIGDLIDGASVSESFTVSLNLSVQQFADAGFVERVENILTTTGFSPSSLKFEVKEKVFFDYKDKATALLLRLRDLGIETDIDDFGAGYSNLIYMTNMPISAIKIDKSIIRMSNEDHFNHKIANSIISMARIIRPKVVAEGVENQTQLEQMVKLGCRYAQGFLFAPPMGINELRLFLSNRESSDYSKVIIESTELSSTTM